MYTQGFIIYGRKYHITPPAAMPRVASLVCKPQREPRSRRRKQTVVNAMMELPDNPPKVDIRKDIYETLPNTAELLDTWDTINADKIANDVVSGLSKALQQRQHHAIEALFAEPSCHWKDTLSFTAHIRTFNGKGVIASALLELFALREAQGFQFQKAQVLSATSELVSTGKQPSVS